MKMDLFIATLIILILCILNFCVALFNKNYITTCGWLVAIILFFIKIKR